MIALYRFTQTVEDNRDGKKWLQSASAGGEKQRTTLLVVARKKAGKLGMARKFTRLGDVCGLLLDPKID